MGPGSLLCLKMVFERLQQVFVQLRDLLERLSSFCRFLSSDGLSHLEQSVAVHSRETPAVGIPNRGCYFGSSGAMPIEQVTRFPIS